MDSKSNEPEKSSIINSFKSAFDDINKSMREATTKQQNSWKCRKISSNRC